MTLEWLELLKLGSIPLIAAVVGWSTNWLAIRLTFYPLEFTGLKPVFGWQGIIPSKARRMAEICVDSTLTKLGTVTEIVEKMNPSVIGQHILASIEPRIDELVDEVMLKRHRTLWQNLPRSVKHIAYQRIEDELPNTIDALVDDMSPKIEELFDLKTMVVAQLEQDKTLLNRIFLECGANEFRFIVRSGLWFGFVFGIPQLLLWYFFPSGWILPICGFAVGWATNWVALNMIFRPVNPTRIIGFTLHGLFLKRQPEVSELFCKLVTEEILTVEKVAQAMLQGQHAERTRALIRKHFEALVDDAAGLIKPLAQVAIGPKGFADIKKETGLKAIDISKETLSDPLFNRERAQAVQEIMAERMRALPSEDFQNLLRPCFQEDEIKLILIGGVLGALAGLAQLVWVFGAPI